MVGLGEVRVLASIRRQDPSHCLDLRPLRGRHECLQPHPPGLTADLVEAIPAALQEDDPPPAGRVPSYVVASRAAVVTCQVPVVEELPGQPVLFLVPPGVQHCSQSPEGVLWKSLVTFLILSSCSTTGSHGQSQQYGGHPVRRTVSHHVSDHDRDHQPSISISVCSTKTAARDRNVDRAGARPPEDSYEGGALSADNIMHNPFNPFKCHSKVNI